MSKALRVIGTIAASVALIATGVGAVAGSAGIAGVASAGTISTIATVAGITAGVANAAAQITAPKPIARGSPAQVVIDVEPPRPYLVGTVMTGGVLRYDNAYGPTIARIPNPYRWQVRVLSGVGPIQGIRGEFFDFEPISGFYTGFYATTQQLGQRPEASALVPPYGFPPGWSASSKLSGCAAVGLNFLFDRDGERFASGLPIYTALADGEKVYDPRQDSTYPGGSGPCRLGVESTYVFAAGNPALEAAMYAYGRFEGGKRVFGLGVSADSIDWPAVVDWANDCDANEWTANIILTEGGTGANLRDQRVRNLDDLCAAGGGRWFEAGGLLSFDWHRPRISLATLTDDDILEAGGGTDAVQTVRDRMNGVRPQYVSPDHNWQMITADEIVGSTYRTEDGEPLTQVYPLNGVTNARQAGELAAYAMADSRELGPMDVQAKVNWRFYRPGDTITVNSSLIAYSGQAVINQRSLGPRTLAVGLSLKSETPEKHPFALGKVANPPPTPTLGQTPEERDLLVSSALRPREIDAEFGATRTQPADVNRVPFSRMERGKGWAVLFSTAASFTPIAPFVVSGRNFIGSDATFSAAGQGLIIGNSPRFQVLAGERLSVQGRIDVLPISGPSPAEWQFSIQYFNAAGSAIGADVIGTGTGSSPSAVFADPLAGFSTVPAGAQSAWLLVSCTSAGAGVIRVAILEPMVSSALVGQTIHPPYVPGANADNGADVTNENTAAFVEGQTAWATWPGLTPAVLEAEVATARADATASLADLNAIANDGVVTRGEKISVRERRTNIMAEFPIWRDRAADFGVDAAIRSNYQAAYDALITYLAAINIDANTNSPVVRADFVAGFNNYAIWRERVIEAISQIAAQRAIWGNVTGSGRPEDGANRTQPANTNRVPFSRFEGDRGWAVFREGSTGGEQFGAVISGRNFILADPVFSTSGQNHYLFNDPPIPVIPGERLSVSSALEIFPAPGGPEADQWQLYVVFLNAAGGFVSDVTIASGVGNSPPVLTTRLEGFVTVPSNGVRAVLNLRVQSAGAGTLRMGFLEPMIASALSGQTVHPPYTPGPNADNGADVTIAQPVVGLLNPVTGRANSRRITSQIVASGVLQTLNTNPISAATDPVTDVSTITINAHTVFDDFGQIDFSGASIGGLSANTIYYIYETNPDFVGGARSYVATTDRNALTVAGRRYVGFVTTPTAGSVPNNGGGGGGAGFPGLNPEFVP